MNPDIEYTQQAGINTGPIKNSKVKDNVISITSDKIRYGIRLMAGSDNVTMDRNQIEIGLSKTPDYYYYANPTNVSIGGKRII
jgi:hypothetical protein